MVEASLKELEEKTKQQKPSLTVRIAQAGLTWSKRQFILISATIGFVLFMVALTIGPGLVPAIAIGFAGAFGVPRWLLSYLKKRREVKFLDNFPDAVDIIVRGVKAGLPLLDCMKMVATEAPEPIKTEFRVIVDTQAIGMPLGEACNKLYERTPLPEANFFAIVVSIQQKAGGNLSEALGNLSRVLRDRKKMKAKIRAMSQEAKASAGIIGSLPIAVMILVSLTSKDYITLLFTEPLGHLMLAGSAFWMMCGVLVMRKMINFDF
jgi:tight adherence protein B